MIGQNLIEMNQATINEAVQFYLNVRVFRDQKQVKVIDVEQNGDSFVVKTEHEQS